MARARANRKAQSARIKRKIDVLRRYFGIVLIKGDIVRYLGRYELLLDQIWQRIEINWL